MRNILNITGDNNIHADGSEHDIVLTTESTIEALTDYETVCTVENAIKEATSPELIIYLAGTIGLTDDNLTFESAVAGKSGFLEKIKSLKNSITTSTDESITLLGKGWRNFTGKSVSGLEKLKEKLNSDDYVVRPEIKKGDVKSINQLLGLSNAMGLNMSNSSDVIKLLELPRVISETVFPENSDILEAMQKDIVKDSDSFKESVASGKIAKASKSVAFLESFKNVKFKDAEFVAGLPTKIFTRTCNLVTVRIVEDKFAVETDIITVAPSTLKPLNKNDLIKVLDTAIKEINNSEKVTGNIKKSLSKINKGFSLIDDDSLVGGAINLLSKNVRFRQNLVKSGTNLMYDFYSINKLAEKLVESSIMKK